MAYDNLKVDEFERWSSRLEQTIGENHREVMGEVRELRKLEPRLAVLEDRETRTKRRNFTWGATIGTGLMVLFEGVRHYFSSKP